MAEFDCFLTKPEFSELLHRALADGYTVHIEKRLTAPARAVCKTASEVALALSAGHHAFLLERPDISRYPLELVPVEKDGLTFWYERSKAGGPVIEAYFFAPFERGGQRVVPCSLVTYHSKMLNPNTGQLEAAGEPIKEAFGLLVGPLRKASRRVKSEKRSAMVSPEVDVLLLSGWSLAAPFAQQEVRDR